MSVANLLSSTSKNSACLEMPKLSTADRVAIVSPDEGTLVYDTTAKNLQYYDGTNWAGVTGSTGGSNTGGVCVFKLGTAENFPSGSSFPVGSLSPTNFTSVFSTFSVPVTVVSGLFNIPVAGVYRISVNLHASVATSPTTGTLVLRLVDNTATVIYTLQYPSCVSTAFPSNFSYNFMFVGQFAENAKVQCLAQNTSNGAFTAESSNDGTLFTFEKIA